MDRRVLLEMIARYASSVREVRWFALPAGVGVLLVLVLALLLRSRRGQSAVRYVLVVLASVGAVYWAWQLRWLCDDAYISFRYADNLARGRGLVFNAGDHVEGYTNFLWTVMLAFTTRIGFGSEIPSLVLSLASYVLLLFLASRVARQCAPASTHFAVPIAAMLCAAQYTMASFGTSGLETMFAAAMALLALERALAGAFLAAGFAGIAAAMAHPDHGILYAGLGLALLLGRDTRAGLVRYAIPFAAVYVPYFAWRLYYYGEFFPNTYYAKSADQAYYGQGAVYLVAFVIGTGFWASLPLLIYSAISERRTLLGRYCLIALPLFCLHVARIGGDFMYGRLLLPLVAPLLVLLECGLARLFDARRFVRGALAAISIAVIALPVRFLQPFEKRWYLSDERTFYPLSSLRPVKVDSIYFDWAKTLIKFFPPQADSPRMAMACVGMIGFYTGWPLVDCFGLTDRTVAHMPIPQRGRPGHEKLASAGYVVSRDVDLFDGPTYPPPYEEITRLRLDGTPFYFVHYDPKVVRKLKHKQGAWIQDYEHYLRAQLRGRGPADPERTACDAWFAEEYYFSRVPRSRMRPRMIERLLGAGRGEGQASDSVAPEFESTHVRDPKTAIHFTPKDAKRLELSGSALRSYPVETVPPGQAWAKGNRGSFVDTFDRDLGDSARGHLRTKPFLLVGDVLELWVGGGHRSERLRVSLLIDDKPVFSAGGCGTEILGRRLWQIAPYKGQQAVLELLDYEQGAWGHLLLDEVVQWVPKPH